RARSGGHPLDAFAAEGLGGGGPRGVRLLPSDERDVANRRSPDRDRARPQDRGHEHGAVPRGRVREPRARPVAAGGRLAAAARRARRHRRDARACPSRGPRPPRVVRSEWTKLRSLRSTRWSLVAGALLTIALPVIFAAVTSSHWGTMSPHERADRHPLDIALAGVNLSQLAIAVLGVLVITGE